MHIIGEPAVCICDKQIAVHGIELAKSLIQLAREPKDVAWSAAAGNLTGCRRASHVVVTF